MFLFIYETSDYILEIANYYRHTFTKQGVSIKY